MPTTDTILHYLGLAMAGVLALTPVAAALRGAARRFQEYAATTPTELDDAAAARLVALADFAAYMLELAADILPVLRVGILTARGDEDRS